jgi:hypothetical protein
VHGETVQFVEYAGASHAADFLPLEATSKGDGDGGGEKKGDGCPGGEQPPPNSDLVSARKLFHTKVEQWFLEPELHPLTGKSQLGVNSTTNNEDQGGWQLAKWQGQA